MNWRRAVAVLIVSQVVLLLLGACWLRVSQLQSFPRHWADESYYGLMAQALVQGEPVFTRTSSGNIPDPFLVALLVPMHLGFGASLTVLRAAAAISGLAAVLLLWRLGRKALDPVTATAAALLLGTAPVAIVYSRMACDFCQTPLIGVLAAYCALTGRGRALFLTLLAGLLVHPTNIFLLPCWLPVYLLRTCQIRAGDRTAQIRGVLRTMVATATVAVPFALWAISNGSSRRFAADSRNPLLFLENFVGFLTLRSGPGQFPRALVWAGLSVAGLLGIVALKRLVERRQWERLTLLVGWLTMLVAFDVQAGAEVLLPLARYGMVLLVPTALAVGVVFRALLPETLEAPETGWADWRILPALGVGWTLLIVTHAQFIHPACQYWDCALLWKPRGVDTYDQLIDRVVADARRRAPDATGEDEDPLCRIWAQEYFLNGLILEYLTSDRPGVEVQSLLDLRTKYWRRLGQPDCFAEESEVLREALEAGDYVVTEDDAPPEMGRDLLPTVVGRSIPSERLHHWRQPMSSGPMLHLYRIRGQPSPPSLARQATDAPPR